MQLYVFHADNYYHGPKSGGEFCLPGSSPLSDPPQSHNYSAGDYHNSYFTHGVPRDAAVIASKCQLSTTSTTHGQSSCIIPRFNISRCNSASWLKHNIPRRMKMIESQPLLLPFDVDRWCEVDKGPQRAAAAPHRRGACSKGLLTLRNET